MERRMFLRIAKDAALLSPFLLAACNPPSPYDRNISTEPTPENPGYKFPTKPILLDGVEVGKSDLALPSGIKKPAEGLYQMVLYPGTLSSNNLLIKDQWEETSSFRLEVEIRRPHPLLLIAEAKIGYWNEKKDRDFEPHLVPIPSLDRETSLELKWEEFDIKSFMWNGRELIQRRPYQGPNKHV
jgi:hypothetical protein